MNYIGEFEKDSTILLELLTIDERNVPVSVDTAPTVTIEHDSGNGLKIVANVTLETMIDGHTHKKEHEIASDWDIGMYIITYTVLINGVQEILQESFAVIDPVVQEVEVIIPSVKGDFVEPTTTTKGYIMPFDFQSPSVLELEGNKVTVKLDNNLKYNHTYTLVLDKSIASENNQTLGETKTITFHSEFKPLLATPLEIHSIIKGLYRYFTIKDIYVAIRDAGQKAFQYLGRVVDPDNTRYREYTERETTYFETTKYVAYEASRTLITSVLIQILNGGERDPSEESALAEALGGAITLGDFSINSKDEPIPGNTLANSAALNRLKALLAEIEKELKFWQDAMMSHNRRGYAKPQTASYRADTGTPEGRDLQ